MPSKEGQVRPDHYQQRKWLIKQANKFEKMLHRVPPETIVELKLDPPRYHPKQS